MSNESYVVTVMMFLYSFTEENKGKCFLLIFRCNSAKKDNDFIYHESVPSLETLPSVKGNRKILDVQFAALYTCECFYHFVHAKLILLNVCMQCVMNSFSV